jgi:tRNA dimethylallyltransferase
LAQRWPLEIIIVDSATIYRGMDIGTAKPSKVEQAFVPHHLLDIRDPAQSYSAAEFQQDATALIRDIAARGNIPLLCGGTMLYYKALREGLNELPAADAVVRTQIDLEAQACGWPELHRQLAGYDPITAARLAPNDSQRLQRAIEIYRISGRPMSAWLADARPRPDSELEFITVSLEPSDRLALHARIASRYQTMINDGLLHEVEALHQRSELHTGLPSVRCVGYRQLWDYLDGKTALNLAVEQAIAATRQLAKRQLTWLRSDPQRHIVDCLAPDAAMQAVDAIAPFWAAR